MDLTSLIQILHEKKIIFQDPSRWEDKNEYSYIQDYLNSNINCSKVFILCFTTCRETYHHWKIYANGKSGARMTFRKDKLLGNLDKALNTNNLSGNAFLAYRPVRYLSNTEVITEPPKPDELIFTKRRAFEDEKEFRIAYISSDPEDKAEKTKKIPISLDCIERITLSPYLDIDLENPVKETLKNIIDNNPIEIYRSTLLDNKAFKDATL